VLFLSRLDGATGDGRWGGRDRTGALRERAAGTTDGSFAVGRYDGATLEPTLVSWQGRPSGAGFEGCRVLKQTSGPLAGFPLRPL